MKNNTIKNAFFFKNLSLYFLILIKFNLCSIREEPNHLKTETEIQFLLESMFNKNIRGFLNFISSLEGTGNNNSEKPSLEQYQILFGGSSFENLLEHPNIKKTVINSKTGKTLVSSASGRYQFIIRTWNKLLEAFPKDILNRIYIKYISKYFKNLNNLYEKNIVNLYKNIRDILKYKFGPFWQDLGALFLIHSENNSLINKIKNANSERDYIEIIMELSRVWASFPSKESGGSYYLGQSSYKVSRSLELYLTHKNLAKSISII